MKSRDEIGVLFEATSVAQETISDAIHVDRARRLVKRLEASGPEFAAVLACVRAIANDLPSRRRDDVHMVRLARDLRVAIAAMLRPAPVGLDRADLHG